MIRTYELLTNEHWTVYSCFVVVTFTQCILFEIISLLLCIISVHCFEWHNIILLYCNIIISMYHICTSCCIILQSCSKLMHTAPPTPNVILVYMLQNNRPFVIPYFIIIPQICPFSSPSTIPSVAHHYHHCNANFSNCAKICIQSKSMSYVLHVNKMLYITMWLSSYSWYSHPHFHDHTPNCPV